MSNLEPTQSIQVIMQNNSLTSTYDHTIWKTRDPVRSPIDKPDTAELVIGSVTTSESSVLYVFAVFFFLTFLFHFPLLLYYKYRSLIFDGCWLWFCGMYQKVGLIS
ncbi:hypothetical protein M434DRAFT_155487 [Hypoxylon sp. CO27-5]|nr:hypothetical protein M434DRAFT_155487 [Hypoxylon sp. CO27-5]